MRILSSLVAFVLSVLLAGAAAARDIHVSNVAGDDRFTGHQPQVNAEGSGPVRTITRALQFAQAGDRIVLEKTDQPYREGISLVGSRHSGYPQQAFAIEGNGAVLDGSLPVPADAWANYQGSVFRFAPPRKGYQQLFLDGLPAVRVPHGRFSGSPPKLEPRQWCLHEGYIYFCVEPTKLPADYRLTYAAFQTGITLYHVERVAIVDLCVQGFQLDGINAFNSARGIYISGVTCRGNGRSGITVGGASTVDIDVCLLGNNGHAQVLTLPLSETHIRNSRLLGNTAPGWADEGGRVYLGDKRIEGGRDEIQPAAEKEKTQQEPAGPQQEAAPEK